MFSGSPFVWPFVRPFTKFVLGMLNLFFSCNQSSVVQSRILTEARSIPGDAHHAKSTKNAALNRKFRLTYYFTSWKDFSETCRKCSWYEWEELEGYQGQRSKVKVVRSWRLFMEWLWTHYLVSVSGAILMKCATNIPYASGKNWNSCQGHRSKVKVISSFHFKKLWTWYLLGLLNDFNETSVSIIARVPVCGRHMSEAFDIMTSSLTGLNL